MNKDLAANALLCVRSGKTVAEAAEKLQIKEDEIWMFFGANADFRRHLTQAFAESSVPLSMKILSLADEIDQAQTPLRLKAVIAKLQIYKAAQVKQKAAAETAASAPDLSKLKVKKERFRPASVKIADKSVPVEVLDAEIEG